MTDARLAAVVVLAAGEGTRMRSATPKVLHALCGRTMLGHVLAAVAPLAPERTLVVVGHGREQVAATLPDTAQPVVQERQDGTGHAVRVALEAAPDADGTVLVLAGDTPLITTETLATLLDTHHAEEADATVLSAVVADPAGLGRIVRDGTGRVARIVEHRDATDDERAIAEVNTSIYAFASAPLRAALTRLSTDNAQGEEYLTDVIGAYVAAQQVVAAVTVGDPMEAAGVNDRVQLAAVRRAFRDRLLEHWMREGVTVVDPQTTWLGVGVRLEPDVVLHQNTQLHGSTVVERGAEVGPDSTLRDVVVGAGATVLKSHCDGAQIGAEATVGPYSFLRPGTVLHRGAKVGAYVEVKASEIGEGSKVPHLSYVGDATIGARSNIGAATVVVNYDGVAKHRTVVGDDVRVGSDTMLVAPVEIGDGAYTAAGSVITEDVPPGALAVARGRQRNIEGWVERSRPGSPAAAAAARAHPGADGIPDESVHSGRDEESSST